MNINENYAKKLHYDVIGIAMAIRGHLGECTLFMEIDEAVQSLDWRKMAIIQYAFDMLTEERRHEILSGLPEHDTSAKTSIEMFNQVLRTMLPQSQPRIA